MPRFGHAQVIGFSEDVCEACQKMRTTLQKAGVDPDRLIAPVQKLQEQTLARNAEQEELKRKTKESTVGYEASLQELYIVSSGVLDTMMAAAGKTSDDARNLQRLRSRIRVPATDSETVAPTDPSVPAAK